MYYCSFCRQQISPKLGYLSNQGQYCCISCINTKQGFLQHSIASILEKIPQSLSCEEQFIKTTLNQVNMIRDRVKEVEARLLGQIKQFRDRIMQFCQCIEAKVHTFQNKHDKFKKQIDELLIKNQSQPIKINNFMKSNHFQPDKVKFSITKDVKHILLKSQQFSTLNLSLPNINMSEEIHQSIKVSDTSITCLKLHRDKVISCTMYGDMYVNNKNLKQPGINIKPANDHIQAVDIYKQSIVSIGNQVRIWNFIDNKLELSKVFGDLGKSVYRLILVNEKLGMILTTTSLAYDYTIKIWSATNYVAINFLQGHTGCIRGLEKGQDNEVISYAIENTIRIWNLQSRKLVRTIKHHQKINFLRYCSKIKMILVFDADNWVTLYYYNFYLKPITSSKWKLSRLTTAIAIDSNLRVVTSKAGKINVFDLYGNKVDDRNITGNSELKSMEMEFDRIWGGTGRGEIMYSELIGTKSILFD